MLESPILVLNAKIRTIYQLQMTAVLRHSL